MPSIASSEPLDSKGIFYLAILKLELQGCRLGAQSNRCASVRGDILFLRSSAAFGCGNFLCEVARVPFLKVIGGCERDVSS